MIKYFLTGVIVVLMGSLYFLNTMYPDVKGRLFFSVFVVLVALVKIWESFYTSKEKDALKYHGDWTLILTSLLYFAAGIVIVLEFFIINRELNLYFITIGSAIFLSAILLRSWSVKTLGNQWAIHVAGPSKLNNELTLITTGPYKYVRHPIYLSYILDLMGLAVAFSAFYALLFVIIINVPSYILRSLFEEKSALKRFGQQYSEYKNKTSFMIPLKKLRASP